MYLRFLIIFFWIIPNFCWAFFCPSNFNQIDYGATQDQVMTQCGKPDSVQTQTVQPEGPQEWSYYISSTVSGQGTTPMPGTLKTQFTFDAEGKAVNISVNGIGVGATTICGSNIQLGDTRDSVKAACGKPSFVNLQNGDTAALGPLPPKKIITIFTYSNAVLVFQNGLLMERR